ncbi:acyl-CoA N-acyltransferases (NAT) superfamily protein [Artemisia annua]|uniref:Acyl-CoA N-acyltransferases (NAT) superfamily protein n=1 Tax=Artemisia annua TaxID=35608 RepID=A0A2U1PUI5_ARTAN|nr:acyl-CoA N-acyltransferases (NAT) superfamily protein [Artemisia annua]
MNPSNSLTLRPFKLSDADDILEYFSDDQVTKFLYMETITTKDEALAYITNVCMPLPYMSICINDRSIGGVSFNHEGHKAEIGYCLARKYWGQGIATQALKMAVKMVLKDFPEIVRLQALTDVENIGSQRVLEKAGFKNEGLLRKYTFIKGSIVDVFIYSFLYTDVTKA